MIKVSVIIPVFNVEKYLKDCLESIITQDEKDIEIICINDGSTDESLKILETYACNDKRVSIINQENQGQAVARNRGISLAKGEYLCFVDSDDKLAEGAIGRLYSIALSEGVPIVSFETELLYDIEVYDDKKKNDRYYYKSKDYRGKRRGMDHFSLLMENDDYCDSAQLLFVKRTWLDRFQIRFVPHIYYEDVLFCLKCHLYADEIYHLPEKLYVYRIRPNSTMRSKASMDKVYSCIVNFEELFSILLRERKKGNGEFCEMLVKYMRFAVMNMHILETNRNDEDSFSRYDYIDKFLYDTFFIGGILHPEERVLKQGIIKCVEDSSGVYLYGAGNVGKIVFDFLTRNGVRDKIKAFVVTKRENCDYEYMGIPIIEFEELSIENELLILSVGRRIQQQIIPVINKRGIYNYICIDRNIDMVLRKEYEKSV